MPMFTIEAPEGAPRAAKQKMFKEITEALDIAYHTHVIRAGCASTRDTTSPRMGGSAPNRCGQSACGRHPNWSAWPPNAS